MWVTIRFRKDVVCVYDVKDKYALEHQIVPFFEHFPSISDEKRQALKSLKKILEIIRKCQHTPNEKEFKKILSLRNQAHSNMSKRTYTDEDLLERFRAFSLKNKDKIIDKTKKRQNIL